MRRCAALSGVDGAARRRVRIGVATWVAQRVNLRDERIMIGLAALSGNEVIPDGTRLAIRQLADELDEAAWDKQDLVETGAATEAEYETAFGLARAATAVLFALDDVDADAAAETCYEAQAAVDDISEVRTLALSHFAH